MRAAILRLSLVLRWSARSFLYYLFMAEASSSTPFSVCLTGLSRRLFLRISAIKSALLVELLAVVVVIVGPSVLALISGRGGRKEGSGGGGKQDFDMSP